MISKSSGGSFILDRKRTAIVGHDYAPGFHVELARKDLRLALSSRSKQARPRYRESPAERLYDEAAQAGFGKLIAAECSNSRALSRTAETRYRLGLSGN